MGMAKVLISIDDELLQQVDARATELGLTRSAFVARLAREHLGPRPERRPLEARRALERARAACRSASDAHPDMDSTEFIRRMRDER
jgi:metal-responsive CopG/Arc/MetJ family transcriptional regulator